MDKEYSEVKKNQFCYVKRVSGLKCLFCFNLSGTRIFKGISNSL